jgi:hypothetical protein
MPHRTRAELEKLMDANSTVRLPDGRLITNKADLPSDSVLASLHRDHLIRTRDAADEAGQKRDVAAIQKEIDEADAKAGAATKAAAKEAAPSSSPADDGGDFDHLKKDELRALCDEHNCDVPANATKAEMAAALAAKGVKPTPE